MPQFRRKPIIVEAVLYDEHAHSHFWFSEDGWDDCPDWLQDASEKSQGTAGAFSLQNEDGHQVALIGTRGFGLVVNIGDYIVRDTDGNIFPVNARVFTEMYEPFTN